MASRLILQLAKQTKANEYLSFAYLSNFFLQYQEVDPLAVLALETSSMIYAPEKYDDKWKGRLDLRQFKRCFFAPSRGIYFWCHSRRICTVDGAFKRTHLPGGVLLTFTVKAANDSLVTLALAHVEVENSWNWSWFYLMIYYTFPGIKLIISDKFCGNLTVRKGQLSCKNFIKRLYDLRLSRLNLIDKDSIKNDEGHVKVYNALQQLLEDVLKDEIHVPVMGGCSVHVMRNVGKGNRYIKFGPFLAKSPTEKIFNDRLPAVARIANLNPSQMQQLKSRAWEYSFWHYRSLGILSVWERLLLMQLNHKMPQK